MKNELSFDQLDQVSGGWIGWHWSVLGISMGGNPDGSSSWVNAGGTVIVTTKSSTISTGNAVPP